MLDYLLTSIVNDNVHECTEDKIETNFFSTKLYEPNELQINMGMCENRIWRNGHPEILFR